ncbi:MAG TPA: glycosyltransferase family 4 protein [Bryobacteraceae bacterium]|nr:glycosyltransferase family 4 protein [Bryobacteraceae bacterium]
MMVRFLTSTPLNAVKGSGTYAGIATLAGGLRALGVDVEVVAPDFDFPIHTLHRLVFNEQLWWRNASGCDAVVGFDMDGYRVAGRRGVPHVASIKGVIADEMRFERGTTRMTMSVQAACERRHVRKADLVMTTSRYTASRLEELYQIPKVGSIVPELIDLAAWRMLFERNPGKPDPTRFTVFCVCRFYPRKRLHLLLRAAARLREGIPELEVRIAGGGPEWPKLNALWRQERLENTVKWLGDVSQDQLAREYQQCDLFCLPSVQEGFGIVFLEAMAAGKPIVAVRAAAVPEVVEQGVLVDPESGEALAEAILALYGDAAKRATLAEAGRSIVERYDAPRVARLFLDEVHSLL